MMTVITRDAQKFKTELNWIARLLAIGDTMIDEFQEASCGIRLRESNLYQQRPGNTKKTLHSLVGKLVRSSPTCGFINVES